MQAGSRVVYLAHPDWGVGIVDWLTPFGHLVVSFEIPGQGPYTGEFAAMELEEAPITQTGLPRTRRLSA